jgi:anaerobic magnesium-protoporphyrin IX monomethyl ester cyclase
MYLAASLEEAGQQVEIVDLTGGRDWRRDIPDLEADLFGVTCVTPNFNVVKEICELLTRGKPVIVGGPHPTFLPFGTLNGLRCDAVVMGEGEVIIRKLVEDVKRGQLKTVYNGDLVPVEEIPKPARHLVDLHKYRPGGEEATPVYTSRGCPFSCAFCSKVTGQTYRPLPVKRVLEEVEDVKSRGFRRIVFGDDNIIVQPRRVRELLKALKPLGVEFRLNQDARNVEDDIVALAKEAGCIEVSFGVESGSQRMLDLMNKRSTVEANRKAISVLRRHGVTAKAYFMANFPGEDEETVKATLRFAEEARPDKWLLSSFAPLPGSDTFQNPEKYGITGMSRNWEDYYLVGRGGGFKPCFTTKELSPERQIYLHDLMYKGLKEILG